MTKEKRDRAGRWKPGSSANPKGRPPGRGLSAELRRTIAQEAGAVVEALLARAKEGDTTAAGLLLARVCPALKPEGLPVELPGLDTGTLSARAEAALAAAGAGVIPPDAAAQLVQSVAGLARVVEVSELVARVEALEGKR